MDNEGSFLDNWLHKTSKNIVKYLAFFIVFALYVLYDTHSAKSEMLAKMDKIEHIMEKQINTVVGVTDDGSLIDIERREVNAIAHANIVGDVIVNNFLVSASDLTDNFARTRFDSVDDIYNASYRLQTLYSEYIILPEEIKNKKLKKLEQKGNGFFHAYLEYLKNALSSNKLPHFINIVNYKVSKYETSENFFVATIEIDVKMVNWVGKDGKGKDKFVATKGVSKVNVEGYFNIKTRTIRDKTKNSDAKEKTGLNKLGLRFTKFVPELLEYNENI